MEGNLCGKRVAGVKYGEEWGRWFSLVVWSVHGLSLFKHIRFNLVIEVTIIFGKIYGLP